MAFVLRPYCRFPAVCPVTYERLFEDGAGNVWNISPTGLRVSGTLPLQIGKSVPSRSHFPQTGMSQSSRELPDGFGGWTSG